MRHFLVPAAWVAFCAGCGRVVTSGLPVTDATAPPAVAAPSTVVVREIHHYEPPQVHVDTVYVETEPEPTTVCYVDESETYVFVDDCDRTWHRPCGHRHPSGHRRGHGPSWPPGPPRERERQGPPGPPREPEHRPRPGPSNGPGSPQPGRSPDPTKPPQRPTSAPAVSDRQQAPPPVASGATDSHPRADVPSGPGEHVASGNVGPNKQGR